MYLAVYNALQKRYFIFFGCNVSSYLQALGHYNFSISISLLLFKLYFNPDHLQAPSMSLQLFKLQIIRWVKSTWNMQFICKTEETTLLFFGVWDVVSIGIVYSRSSIMDASYSRHLLLSRWWQCTDLQCHMPNVLFFKFADVNSALYAWYTLACSKNLHPKGAQMIE